jgi:hypothetical protein
MGQNGKMSFLPTIAPFRSSSIFDSQIVAPVLFGPNRYTRQYRRQENPETHERDRAHDIR